MNTLVQSSQVGRKSAWVAHKWLILRRVSQAAVLALFLLGPFAGI